MKLNCYKLNSVCRWQSEKLFLMQKSSLFILKFLLADKKLYSIRYYPLQSYCFCIHKFTSPNPRDLFIPFHAFCVSPLITFLLIPNFTTFQQDLIMKLLTCKSSVECVGNLCQRRRNSACNVIWKNL